MHKKGSSISGKQNIKVSGLESFRKSLIDLGLSKSATSPISSARRPSSNSNFNSSWGKWVSWCSRKEIDPVQCSVNFVLDFPAENFDLGYKYSSINLYRSEFQHTIVMLKGNLLNNTSKCVLF